MIRTQQESIDTLKKILTQFLEDKKMPTDKAFSKKSKGKRKEGESSSSVHIEEKGQSNSKSSKFSSKEGGNPENEGTHSKRMTQLEQRLEALTNRKGFQDAGVVRPYPVEWDLISYTPKFKAPTLRLSTAKGHRTNTSTTSSLRQEM